MRRYASLIRGGDVVAVGDMGRSGQMPRSGGLYIAVRPARPRRRGTVNSRGRLHQPPGARMKIRSIQARVHQLEVRVPLLTQPIRRKAVLCEVETDDGHVGHGLTGGAYLPFAIATAIEKEFFPLLKGMDPRAMEAIHEKVWWKINQRSMTGVVSSALSAIDIACWDIHGKATGRTVAQLLGGARDWAPTYCTFGFHEYDRDQLVEAAK